MATPAPQILHTAIAEDATGPGNRVLVTVENGVLAVAFFAAVLLPLTEIALRALASTGIEGASTLVRHLTLTVGMLGAAVAARERRLLTLAVTPLLAGRYAGAAHLVSSSLAAAISVLLTVAAVDFVGIEREAGNTLVYAFPVWIAQIPLPLGFALIAVRLTWNAGRSHAARLLAAAMTLTAALALGYLLANPEGATGAVLVVMLVALLLGTPIFAVIGGTGMFLLSGWGVPSAAVAVNHYSLVVNPSLPAIPMFTLAGYLLAESQAPRRLLVLFHALFGRLRGGAAIVSVLACTFFTCFTGASGVTILALGGLVMPLLLGSGYSQRAALGLVTAGGLPGVLLVPALPLILYAIVAKVSLEEMFLGGLLPAALMLTIVAAWGVAREQRREPDEDRPGIDWKHVRSAVDGAKWELSVPVVAVLALASGLATPVEAAAVTALYAFVITVLIHADLDVIRDVPRVVAECGLMVGGILLILGVALSLTNYLVDAQVPDTLVAWVTQTVEHRWTFLLALNVLLIAAGCIMDIFTAIVVLVPLVIPLGQAFGIHPVHLGIIFLANLEIGYLTPPVGMNLFFSSYRFDKPIAEVFRSIIPLFAALGVGLLAITYMPWLSTALPQWLQ
jgi:tripartite ATP-independent transporter DctM subunit